MESVRGTTQAFPGFHLRRQEGGRQWRQLPFWQLAAALISRKMVWKPQAAASWRVHLLQALSLDQLLWGLLCSWWCHLWSVFHVWDAVFNNNLWKVQNWLLKKASFICHRKSVKLMRYWLDPDMSDTWRMVKVIDQVVKRMLNLCFQLNFSSFSFPSLFYSGFKEWDCRLIALWTNYLTAKGHLTHSLPHVTSLNPTPDDGLQWCTSALMEAQSYFPFPGPSFLLIITPFVSGFRGGRLNQR